MAIFNVTIKKTIILSCLCGILISCKKFITVNISPELVATPAVFETEASVLSAVNGVYLRLRNTNLDMSNAGMSIYGGLSSDEIYNTATNTSYDPFQKNSLTNNNAVILQNFWRASYRTIYSVNAVIEGLKKSTQLSQETKNKYLGEMLVVRAWHYFYLINLFGDVPLILETDYEINSAMPRIEIAAVYAQIIADLKSAKDLLSNNYPSAGKVRPNKLTAAALLSRVYLFTRNFELAAKEASEVISSDRYALVNDLNSVFLINSNETIWEVAPANEAANTQIGTIIVPTSATTRPAMALNTDFVQLFSSADLRLANWIRSNTNSGVHYYYPYKQKQRTVTTPIAEYNPMIRYDEVLLIRAEARAELEQADLGLADLNVIRKRAGIADTTTHSKEGLLAAIWKERRMELFLEWGHRWLDLKRTGQIDTVMKALKGDLWQETDALFPIPLVELDYNPQLKQNKGY